MSKILTTVKVVATAAVTAAGIAAGEHVLALVEGGTTDINTLKRAAIAGALAGLINWVRQSPRKPVQQ